MTISSETTPNDKSVHYIPIKVKAGILLHIGAGIYSSVAGAVKELVSNAYDADARTVVISTNYPVFDKFVIADNGTGMTAKRFEEAMQSIGNSIKGTIEPTRVTPEFKRPIIGHLGIGLMALSQVCDRAIIESQVPGARTKFIAKLDFTEFTKATPQRDHAVKLATLLDHLGSNDSVDQFLTDPNTPKEAKQSLKQLLDEVNRLEGENLGYCMVYDDLPAVEGQRGTIITLEGINSAVLDKLSDQNRSLSAMPKSAKDRGLDWADFGAEVNEWSWRQLCEKLQIESGGLSHQSLPGYHQFLWELALTTPVCYFDDAPILLSKDTLKKKKRALKAYDFNLIVDQRNLLKPILLPGGQLARNLDVLEPKYDYTLTSVSFSREIEGSPLSFSGYIYWQRKQIQPSTIRGLQIYIRNIGIGTFDNTLLKFSTVNPTSRAGQISGEIYADEGLERALNIDRRSFRETDAHYQAFQNHIWELLGSAARGQGIIGGSIDSYWVRKERSESEENERHVESLKELIHTASRGKVSLRFYHESNELPYEFRRNSIAVYDASPAWPRAASERRLAQRVIIPIKAAVESNNKLTEILSLLESILLRE
jgi:hypothetical protein